MLKRQVERACRPESMKQCQPTMPHAMPSVKEHLERWEGGIPGGGEGIGAGGNGKNPSSEAKQSKRNEMIYGVQHNEL